MAVRNFGCHKLDDTEISKKLQTEIKEFAENYGISCPSPIDTVTKARTKIGMVLKKIPIGKFSDYRIIRTTKFRDIVDPDFKLYEEIYTAMSIKFPDKQSLDFTGIKYIIFMENSDVNDEVCTYAISHIKARYFLPDSNEVVGKKLRKKQLNI